MEDTGRISVSRDALRAELGSLELRLVQSLATQSEVDDLKRRVDRLETWRAFLAGAQALFVFLVGVALILITYFF